jgi:hypothetical protein
MCRQETDPVWPQARCPRLLLDKIEAQYAGFSVICQGWGGHLWSQRFSRAGMVLLPLCHRVGTDEPGVDELYAGNTSAAPHAIVATSGAVTSV